MDEINILSLTLNVKDVMSHWMMDIILGFSKNADIADPCEFKLGESQPYYFASIDIKCVFKHLRNDIKNTISLIFTFGRKIPSKKTSKKCS